MTTRCYFVISVGTLASPSEEAWENLAQQAKDKTMISTIIQAARAAQNYLTHKKRSLGTGQVRKNTLCGFEVEEEHEAAILAVLNSEASSLGITGTVRQKFIGVLQNELRTSAVELGYTQNQANQLTVSVVGFGTRTEAISEVIAYLVANSSIWY